MKGSKNFDNTPRTNLSGIQIQGNQRGVMRSRCLKQQVGPTQQEKEYNLRKMMLSSYGRSAGKTSQVDSHSVERRQNDLSELEMQTFSNNTILLYGIDCLEEKRIENYFSPLRVSVQFYDHSHYSVLFQSTEVMITALYKALPSHQTYSYQKLKENCLQNDKFQAEWRQLKPLFDRKLWFRILNNWDYMNRQNQSDFHKKPVHQKSQRNMIPYDQSEDKSQNIDSSNQLNKPPRKRRGRNSQNSKNSNDSRSNSKNNSRQRSNESNKSNKSNKSRSRSRQQRNDHPVKNHCQQSNCKGDCYQFITQLKQLLSHHCTAHSSRSVDRNQRNNSRRQQSQKFQQKKQFYYNRYNNPTGQSQKKQNMMTTRDRSLLEDKERTDSAFEDHSSIHEEMQMLSDDEEQNQVFKLVNQMKNYVIFEQSQESNQIQEQPLFNLQNSYIQNQENTRFLS